MKLLKPNKEKIRLLLIELKNLKTDSNPKKIELLKKIDRVFRKFIDSEKNYYNPKIKEALEFLKQQ